MRRFGTPAINRWQTHGAGCRVDEGGDAKTQLNRTLSGVVIIIIVGVVGTGLGYYVGLSNGHQPSQPSPVPVQVSLTVLIVNETIYRWTFALFLNMSYETSPNETYFLISYSFYSGANTTLTVSYQYPEIGGAPVIDAYAIQPSATNISSITWYIYPHRGDFTSCTDYVGRAIYAAFMGHSSYPNDIWGLTGLSAVAYENTA